MDSKATVVPRVLTLESPGASPEEEQPAKPNDATTLKKAAARNA
jgi:hypothetical protein